MTDMAAVRSDRNIKGRYYVVYAGPSLTIERLSRNFWQLVSDGGSSDHDSFREARDAATNLIRQRIGVKPGEVTAETVTDEQIRALLDAFDPRVVKAARCALGLSRGGVTAQKRARARIAAAINARAKGGVR
jgi:hypothetical protein